MACASHACSATNRPPYACASRCRTVLRQRHMRQFLKLFGRTRKGNLTAQPQRLPYRPRRPATLLYQLKSAVQGEKIPCPHSGQRRCVRFTSTCPSAWSTVRVRLPFEFVFCPHCGHSTSSYLPSPCCNNISPQHLSHQFPPLLRQLARYLIKTRFRVLFTPIPHRLKHLFRTSHELRLRLFPFHLAPPFLFLFSPTATLHLFRLSKNLGCTLFLHPSYQNDMRLGLR